MINLRKTGKPGPPKSKIPPNGTGRPGDREINEALAIYNKTGNYLALWQVLEACLGFERSLPPEVATVFRRMAQKLLEFSPDEFGEARSRVPDIILGTTNQAGGPSVFEDFAREIRNRRYLAVVDELVREHILNKQVRRPAQKARNANVSNLLPDDPNRYAWSLERVYEAATDRLAGEGEEVTLETIKRLYEQENKNADVFKTNAIIAAKRRDEIVEIKAVDRPRGRKRDLEDTSD